MTRHCYFFRSDENSAKIVNYFKENKHPWRRCRGKDQNPGDFERFKLIEGDTWVLYSVDFDTMEYCIEADVDDHEDLLLRLKFSFL